MRLVAEQPVDDKPLGETHGVVATGLTVIVASVFAALCVSYRSMGEINETSGDLLYCAFAVAVMCLGELWGYPAWLRRHHRDESDSPPKRSNSMATIPNLFSAFAVLRSLGKAPHVATMAMLTMLSAALFLGITPLKRLLLYLEYGNRDTTR